MMKSFFKKFVELTGNPMASSLLRNFSKSPVSKPLVRPFARVFRLNENEMERPIKSYQSIHDLFTRRLIEGARPIDDQPDTIISPVDGVIQTFGKVNMNHNFYIKEQLYKLDELLGDDKTANRFRGGDYIVIYLSPSHYHRIHYPVNGEVCKRWAIGEQSYPVNALGEKFGDKPFSTNYRIITELVSSFGRTALVKVGALNINSIVLTNSNSKFNKGDEAGYFSFGSTVILFFDKESRFIPEIHPLQEICMGQIIGRHGN
ncbi:phosphatidylserine decarboxylase [Aciduricibacillus chroicocephali]|uniref:phosphatidylserine decarboxylase n=1 Tax=Aciduricibacillus chroicocephali TaxID=3054939 RepID=A0ABY9KZD3_9BACI|nr:phosphatidylserine decarboxylase [Bacillaceae bacterium 44XB]